MAMPRMIFNPSPRGLQVYLVFRSHTQINLASVGFRPGHA